jgi:hypothetical protein
MARTQCALDADKAGCQSLFLMESTCRADEMDAGLAAPCANAPFKDFYDNVVPLFCGQAISDAGVPLDAGLADAALLVSTDGGLPAASDASAD